MKKNPKPTKEEIHLFIEKLKMINEDYELKNECENNYNLLDARTDIYKITDFQTSKGAESFEKMVDEKYPTINKIKNFTYEKYGEMLINLAWIDKDIVKKFNPQTQIPNNDYGFSIQVNLAMLSDKEKDILKTLSDPISFLKEVNYHNRFIINLYPLYDAKDVKRIKNLANHEELKEMRQMVEQGKKKELIKYIKNNFHQRTKQEKERIKIDKYIKSLYDAKDVKRIKNLANHEELKEMREMVKQGRQKELIRYIKNKFLQRTKKEKKRIYDEQHFSDIYLDSAKINKEIGMYNRIKERMNYQQKEKPYMKKYDKINLNNIKSKINTGITKNKKNIKSI